MLQVQILQNGNAGDPGLDAPKGKNIVPGVVQLTFSGRMFLFTLLFLFTFPKKISVFFPKNMLIVSKNFYNFFFHFYNFAREIMRLVQFQLVFLYFLVEICLAADWKTFGGVALTRLRTAESDRLNGICGFAPKREEISPGRRRLIIGHGENAKQGEFPWVAVLMR